MPRPLKILCVEPYIYARAHPRSFATGLCGGLGRRGHEVTLVCFGNVPAAGVEEPRPFSVFDVAKRHSLDGLQVGRGPSGSQAGTLFDLHRLYWDLRTYPPAFRIAADQTCDVVHCLDWHPVTLWWVVRYLSARRSGAGPALVGTLHHLGRLARGKDSFLGMSVRYYHRALYALVTKYMQAVFVLDESLRREAIERLELSSQFQERIVTVPHGMDTGEPPYGRAEARRRLGIAGDERMLLLLGVLRRDKGMDVAIRAMEGTRSCRLYIVGAPYDCSVAELRALIREYHCQESIILDARHLAEDEMQDYILASDALLLPYHKTFRGQSGVIAHACQYARCVIASDVGAVGNTIRQFGFGLAVEPERPAQLREAIASFLGLAESARLEMESNAKRTSEFCSWDAVSRRFEEVYNRCVDDRAKASRVVQ